jgi:hypothetical protein
MAFMGWKTPKTAIGYVAKSRLSAFNMSMFLCNVQRQNKDLDSIVEASRPSGSKLKSKEKSKKKNSAGEKNEVVVVNREVEAAKSDIRSAKFSNHLASARLNESVSKTREAKQVEVENRVVVRDINEEIVSSAVGVLSDSLSEKKETKASHAFDHVSRDIVGSGGGGVGGVEKVHVPVERVDSDMSENFERHISGVLSNFQHQGQLHLHFHFGKD